MTTYDVQTTSVVEIPTTVNVMDATVSSVNVVEVGLIGPQGGIGNTDATGDPGILIAGTAPSNHDILWADTATTNAQVAVFDGGTPASQLTSIKTRRGVASVWTSINPVLDAGEFGYESDTTKFKIGNGSTTWNSLSYATAIATTMPATGLTGTTMASNVVSSSLTSFGSSPTISSPTLTGTITMTGATVAGGTINGGTA